MVINFHRVFPNLRCVVLDPLARLPFVTRPAFSQVRSLGSAILRKLLCRFTAVVPDTMEKEPWAVHPFVGLELFHTPQKNYV